jgi:hypothetical protein
MKDDVRLLKILLEKGADPDDTRCTLTPLQRACLDGSQHLAHILLDAGADLNQVHDTSSYTEHTSTIPIFAKPPIQLAIENGHLDLFHLLKARGSNPMLGNWNLLVSACMGKLRDLVETLLVGTPPLTHDVLGLAACVEYLGCDQVEDWIERGIVDRRTLLRSPQAVCAMLDRGGGALLSRLLLEERRRGRTLHPECAAVGIAMAAKLGDANTVRVFLDLGARPDAVVEADIRRFQHRSPHCMWRSHACFFLKHDTDAIMEALKAPRDEIEHPRNGSKAPWHKVHRLRRNVSRSCSTGT